MRTFFAAIVCAAILATAGVASAQGKSRVVGTADFNGDGKSDIVVFTPAYAGLDPEIKILFIDGHEILATWVWDHNHDYLPGWEPLDVGNFDGKPGVLWRDLRNGRLAVWHMDFTGAPIEDGGVIYGGYLTYGGYLRSY